MLWRLPIPGRRLLKFCLRWREFKKDPTRWAATPKFRFQLHWEVENKLAEIAAYKKTQPVHLNPHVAANLAVVTSGVDAAYTSEVMQSFGLWDSLPLFQVLQPFPLHTKFINHLLSEYEDILVIEETMAVIEMQLADRYRVKGKLNRVVPRVGELLPEKIQQHVANFAGVETKINSLPSVPGRRPTLCAGCSHRASFFAIKKAAPKGIYTSDIGCYTLGLNLKAVRYSRDNGPAVVIARHPCIIDSARRSELIKRADVNVNQEFLPKTDKVTFFFACPSGFFGNFFLQNPNLSAFIC